MCGEEDSSADGTQLANDSRGDGGAVVGGSPSACKATLIQQKPKLRIEQKRDETHPARLSE